MLKWTHLSEDVSFYVSLIERTWRDIQTFSLLIILLLLYIGSAMSMLQQNSEYQSQENSVIEKVSGFFLFDAILNQYLMLLGEFHMDGFKEHSDIVLCYTIFLAATFIGQIMFLNMLIAIMSDSYELAMDKRPTHSLKNKMDIMGTMAC